jgi:RNA polymerase sigma-70 factor (ECF subfamily)
MDAVYRMARRLAPDEAEAEDLVQETFLRAYRAFDDFELREYGAKPWLLKILYNVFCTHRGKQSRERVAVDGPGVEALATDSGGTTLGETGTGEVDWEQFDDEIKLAVEALQPEYRAVLLLWALEELSYKEIAEVCDIPIGTVMSRLYRGRQQVGRQLAEYARERNIKSARF